MHHRHGLHPAVQLGICAGVADKLLFQGVGQKPYRRHGADLPFPGLAQPEVCPHVLEGFQDQLLLLQLVGQGLLVDLEHLLQVSGGAVGDDLVAFLHRETHVFHPLALQNDAGVPQIVKAVVVFLGVGLQDAGFFIVFQEVGRHPHPFGEFADPVFGRM